MNASHAESQESPAPVQLRGTRTGLEIFVEADVPVDEITDGLEAKLNESPSFFDGGDVSLRFDGDPPAGALGRLEEIAGRFGLRVIEVRSNREERDRARRAALAAVVSLENEEQDDDAPAPAAAPDDPAPEVSAQPEPESEPHAEPEGEAEVRPSAGPRLATGPIRSGVRLEAPGDLVVFGDVNPGAELFAGRNIVVLGVLRGVAHACAAGGQDGFVLALRLQPQQVRIGALVARAGDSETPPEGAEIAYAAGGRIIVEQYAGKLPGGVAATRR